MISEISDGIKDTKVKPGIIGEVGTSWPFTDFEKRSLQAAAEAQIQTQTPVMLHPAENSKAPFEVLRLFQEAGGDAKRSVMIMRFQTTSKLSSLLTWVRTWNMTSLVPRFLI
ncbi:phosphotriesterase-related isoform X2 [Paramuricea clavata]|uniref:Phosphotriesterase-related isoform X2 n=1 Tax=Paramuricea clavata TaxID=317549 RepID=A0A7D9D7I0_PARCT|nr:phosphotriesterase-related isoform X2 [Paramuricea clavata]